MWPTLNLGPLVVPTGALTIVLGAWLCLHLVERSARTLDQEVEKLANLAFTGLAAGIIGARLTFVLLYWPAFRASLISILWPLNTGYNMWGGLLFGALAALFYGRYHQLRPAPTLDALAPALVAGLMVVSLADFVGGPGFGTTTTLPWGVSQFAIRRHPVQIYELLVGGLALLTWLRLRRRRAFAGQLFLATTAVYGFGRLFVDAFRADAWVSAGGWHVLQLLALLATLTCLLLLAQRTLRADR